MTVFVSDYLLDNGVSALSEADQIVACTGQAATFYEVVDPSVWAASTAYAIGDAARPTARNSFVYEVTGAGTIAGTEPVSWTARASRALASVAMVPGDFSLLNGDVSGRKSVSATKNGVAAHTTGTIDHMAYVDRVNKRLLMVDLATTPIAVTGGNSTLDFGQGQWESRGGQAV